CADAAPLALSTHPRRLGVRRRSLEAVAGAQRPRALLQLLEPGAHPLFLGPSRRELGAQRLLTAARPGRNGASGLELPLEAFDGRLLAHEGLPDRRDFVLEAVESTRGRQLV